MSEAKTSTGSKTKTASAPKAESKAASKSESAAPKAEAAPKAKDAADGAAAASSESKSSEGKSSEGVKDGGTESGKSVRDSIGGKADVHYGYFSSVRTPAYRSGWDAIWGSDNGSDDGDGEAAPSPRATRRAAKTRRRRDPITVTLDLDDLPPALRDGLVEIARAELKKSRVSYARRDKAGAVDWRITCRVD